MLIMIKSSPDTAEARRALDMASNEKAEVVFLQAGVYHAAEGRLDAAGLTRAYAIGEDMAMRGVVAGGHVEAIDYDALVDLMYSHENISGLY